MHVLTIVDNIKEKYVAPHLNGTAGEEWVGGSEGGLPVGGGRCWQW